MSMIGTTVETTIGIIAACFPCLRPLFKAVLNGSFQSRVTQERSSQGGYLRSTRSEGTFNRDFEMRRRDDLTRENGSEETILSPTRDKLSDGGIIKTTQVSIDRR